MQYPAYLTIPEGLPTELFKSLELTEPEPSLTKPLHDLPIVMEPNMANWANWLVVCQCSIDFRLLISTLYIEPEEKATRSLFVSFS